jgi:hypothetical protein
MDDELTPEQQFAAEDAETLVPRALLLGKKPDDVVADLVKLDWSPPAAKAFVERVIEDMRQFRASPEGRQRLIANAFKQFIGGSLFVLIGVGIGAVSFLLLLGGLVLIVMLGVALLVFGGGLVTGGRGWSRWWLYKSWSVNIEQAEKGNRDGDRQNEELPR